MRFSTDGVSSRARYAAIQVSAPLRNSKFIKRSHRKSTHLDGFSDLTDSAHDIGVLSLYSGKGIPDGPQRLAPWDIARARYYSRGAKSDTGGKILRFPIGRGTQNKTNRAAYFIIF